MIKAIHFIKRKPGMELEAFRAYWLAGMPNSYQGARRTQLCGKPDLAFRL